MRIRFRRFIPLALGVALVAGGCDERRETRNFAWQGDLDGERWVRVRNLNGPVNVVRSPDARATIGVVVTGTGIGRLELLDDEDANGITVCLVRGGSDCDQSQASRRTLNRLFRRVLGLGDGNYSATYTLYVPSDARVDVATVNGAVTVESAAREFRVKTVNGAVRITAIGEKVKAESVNGQVTAAIDLVGTYGAIDLSTVNGSVTAELPSSLGANVSLKTVNGRVQTDFESDVGPGGPRRAKSLDLVIGGGGGHRVSLRTVNGSATLKKRG